MTTKKREAVNVKGCLADNFGRNADAPAQILNPKATPPEHRRCWWGDMWSGTKGQLQAIGIGVGASFPGESAGPAWCLTVCNAHGVEVTIQRDGCVGRDDVFAAYRRFWDPTESRARRRRERTTVFAPGVNCYQDEYRDDLFTGTADALVAAGLIGHDQLPGQPGRGKVHCTYLPDGTPVRAGQNLPATAGYRAVVRLGKSQYRVTVRVTDEEIDIRSSEREAYEAFEKRAFADARAMIEQEELLERRQRGHLRLVWSRL